MIHGVFYKNIPSQDDRRAIEHLHEDLVLSTEYYETISETFPGGWLAQSIEKTTSSLKNSGLISLGSPPRATIAAWARIDNRDELASMMDISSQTLKSLTDPELILHAYLTWKDECTAHLLGDFCFAIYDHIENRLFCARDHMGIKPFYYYDSKDMFVFSSSLTLFHRLPTVTIKPRLEWASRFLLTPSLVMDFEKTAYQSILKLVPAHQCLVTTDRMHKKRYFSFHTNKIQLKTSQEYVDFYQEQLDAAVKRRTSVNHPLGSELSGGIDSSTVTAYARKYYAGSMNDFHAFGFSHYEHEPKHMLRVSQHLGIYMTHVCCNASAFLTNHLTPLKVLGAPNQHSTAVTHQIFYNLAAQQGIKTLLSGFGGDEFVTSLHGYLYLHELLNSKQYLQLYINLPGDALGRSLRFLKYVWKCRNQRGVQDKHMAEAYNKRWPLHVLNEDVVQNYTLKEAYDTQGLFDYGYHNLDQFTLENRHAPFIGTRTEECTLMAGSYGIEYRWPLLDVRLIQTFLSIPSSEKYHRGVGRYLHKRAIAKLVPQNVIEQGSKYMGVRVHSPQSKQTILNEDLHPELWKLVNQPKLREQEKHLLELEKHQPRALQNPEFMPLQHNILLTNALDNWLKYYFGNNCEWDNLPAVHG